MPPENPYTMEELKRLIPELTGHTYEEARISYKSQETPKYTPKTYGVFEVGENFNIPAGVDFCYNVMPTESGSKLSRYTLIMKVRLECSMNATILAKFALPNWGNGMERTFLVFEDENDLLLGVEITDELIEANWEK